MVGCKWIFWFIWNFLILKWTSFILGAWKPLSPRPIGVYWKNTKMVVETTSIIYKKNPYVQCITSPISLVWREALQILHSFPLSPSAFIFTISFKPCHAQTWKQFICKCIKETNKDGKKKIVSSRHINTSKKMIGRNPRGDKVSPMQRFFLQAM